MSQSDTQVLPIPFIQSEIVTVNQSVKFQRRVVKNVSQSTTLTSDDSGVLIQVTTPGITLTLPPTSLAYTYEIVNDSSIGSFTIQPSRSDLIVGGGLAKTTQKVTDGQEVVLNPGQRGDSITLTGDGVDGWVVSRIVGNQFRYV